MVKKDTVVILLGVVLTMCGCGKKGPLTPLLEPPGQRTGFLSQYNSIQLLGDLNSWDINNIAGTGMSLVADYRWEKAVDFPSSVSIQFKFAANGSWSPASFGGPAGGTQSGLSGTAVLDANSSNLRATIPSPGRWKFSFNEQTSEYAITLVAVQTGSISGTVRFGDVRQAPYPRATVQLYTHGDSTVLTTTSSDTIMGGYDFTGLADGSYDLRISAPAYRDTALQDVRVSQGGATTAPSVELTRVQAATPDPPYRTIVIDGAIDAGWPPADTTSVSHSSNWGSSNNFNSLYVAWDLDSLYIGVDGGFGDVGGNSNTVNLYIDKDYGSGTGLRDMSTITDTTDVANHLRKTVTVNVAAYGADLAYSIWGLQYGEDLSDLSNPAHLGSLAGWHAKALATGIEIGVSWNTLYGLGAGRVPPQSTLGIVAVIGGGGDDYLADDCIPQQGDVHQFAGAFTIVVDSDGQ